MGTVELATLKQGIKQYIDEADERVVVMIQAMLEADQQQNSARYDQLSPEQEAILSQHITLYEQGKMTFSTWGDVKARITSR